jgi:hypothetical protein
MRSIGVPTQYGWYPRLYVGGTSIGLGSWGTQTNDGGAKLRSHINLIEIQQEDQHVFSLAFYVDIHVHVL